jgi:hypothetical protein
MPKDRSDEGSRDLSPACEMTTEKFEVPAERFEVPAATLDMAAATPIS